MSTINKCVICKNSGEWFDKELVLQLDHINGVRTDNRIENLRFLCPNCHTQTETYSSKNKNSVRKRKAEEVKKEKDLNGKEKLINDRKKILDSIDINSFGWVRKVQDAWGVSHSQVRRWIKRYYPEIIFFERKNAPLV